MSLKYQEPHVPMFGKGSILLDLLDASENPTGYFHAGNVTKFEPEIKDTMDELYQSINKVPTLIATAVKQRKPQISITGTDFKAKNVGMALMSAGVTPLAVAAGPVTDELLASAAVTKKGKYFALASRSVDPDTVVLTQAEPATVLTFNQVEVGEGEAVYFYTGYTGPAPRVGMSVTVTGFATSGNNVTATLAAVSGGAAGFVSVVATSQADETHSGSGTTTGATTLTAGTDYIVEDGSEALVYFPATSTVDDSVAVIAAYTKLVANFSQVAGATVPFVKVRIRFVPDPTDGQKLGCEVWKVNLSPNGAIGLIADAYGNWTLDGTILDDTANHPDCPYFLVTIPEAA